jgi:AbrB family looped-hinge helix DNA binding protein
MKKSVFLQKNMNFHTNQTNMLEEQGKYIFGVVKVGDRGQIVIPKDAREIYGIKAGDSLLILGDKKGMAILKTEVFQDKINEVLGED